MVPYRVFACSMHLFFCSPTMSFKACLVTWANSMIDRTTGGTGKTTTYTADKIAMALPAATAAIIGSSLAFMDPMVILIAMAFETGMTAIATGMAFPIATTDVRTIHAAGKGNFCCQAEDPKSQFL